jgi:hypothetical protein
MAWNPSMQVLEKIYLVQFNEALTLPVNEALTLLGRVELDVRLALRRWGNRPAQLVDS